MPPWRTPRRRPRRPRRRSSLCPHSRPPPPPRPLRHCRRTARWRRRVRACVSPVPVCALTRVAAYTNSRHRIPAGLFHPLYADPILTRKGAKAHPLTVLTVGTNPSRMCALLQAVGVLWRAHGPRLAPAQRRASAKKLAEALAASELSSRADKYVDTYVKPTALAIKAEVEFRYPERVKHARSVLSTFLAPECWAAVRGVCRPCWVPGRVSHALAQADEASLAAQLDAHLWKFIHDAMRDGLSNACAPLRERIIAKLVEVSRRECIHGPPASGG